MTLTDDGYTFVLSDDVTRTSVRWRAWEHLCLDPALGMSMWLRDHADHHLPILCKYGPSGKAQDTSEIGAPLPYTPPPRRQFSPTSATRTPGTPSATKA